MKYLANSMKTISLMNPDFKNLAQLSFYCGVIHSCNNGKHVLHESDILTPIRILACIGSMHPEVKTYWHQQLSIHDAMMAKDCSEQVCCAALRIVDIYTKEIYGQTIREFADIICRHYKGMS
jgi:hypothetical protein